VVAWLALVGKEEESKCFGLAIFRRRGEAAMADRSIFALRASEKEERRATDDTDCTDKIGTSGILRRDAARNSRDAGATRRVLGIDEAMPSSQNDASLQVVNFSRVGTILQGFSPFFTLFCRWNWLILRGLR
jgi:hypothetical protein